MRIAVFIWVLFLVDITAWNQNIQLSMDSASVRPFRKQWGRNYCNMITPHLQVNWPLGANPGAGIIHHKSVNFRIGADYKRKINGLFSFGFRLQYGVEDFHLQQDSMKIFPDTIQHKSEWYNLHNIITGGFLRFNFNPHRGNHYGTYLEIGINHVWSVAIFHGTRDLTPLGNMDHVKQLNPSYMNHSNAEVYTKLGWKHIAAILHIRFTRSTGKSYHLPDLPMVKLGMELAW